MRRKNKKDFNYEDSIWVSDKLYFTGTFNVFFGRRDCTERLFREGNRPPESWSRFRSTLGQHQSTPAGRKMGVQGFVVAFDVNEQGEMVDLRVTESKPSLVLIKRLPRPLKN